MGIRTANLARQHWESAIDLVPQLVCLIDRAGTVRRANRAAESWKPKITAASIAAKHLHEALHRGCSDPACYLKRFEVRAIAALARGKSARCDAWDPLFKRHFSLRASPSAVAGKRNSSNASFAIITIEDVTRTRTGRERSKKAERSLAQRVAHEVEQRVMAEKFQRRLLTAVDRMPTLVAMADEAGKLAYLNSAGRALLGIGMDEKVPAMTLLDCHAPSVREQLLKQAFPTAAREGLWTGDSILLTRDGREIKSALVIIAHYDDKGNVDCYSAHERDMTDWIRSEQAIHDTRSELTRMAAQHLTIQESERRRIATDLHDGLGQLLSLLKISIKDVARLTESGGRSEIAAAVKSMLSRADSALVELRRIAMGLRPSTLDDLGLVPTLSWFFREFEASGIKVAIDADISVKEADVPEPLKIAIFRILQEAVSNAIKHSGADRIKVHLSNGRALIHFSVEDNGKGFDPANVVNRDEITKGLGLQSMKERTELSGGRYAIASALGQGTKVCAWWPSGKGTKRFIVCANETPCGADFVAGGFSHVHVCSRADCADAHAKDAEEGATLGEPLCAAPPGEAQCLRGDESGARSEE